MKAIAPNSASPTRNTTTSVRVMIGCRRRSTGRIGSGVRRSTQPNAVSRTIEPASHHHAPPPFSPPKAMSSELTPAKRSDAPSQSTVTGLSLRDGGYASAMTAIQQKPKGTFR
jgi:hypothetical protein